MKRKNKVRREIIEWAVFLGVIAFLFGTGLHTPVFGFIQGLVLKTGIIQPSIDTASDKFADYEFSIADREGNNKSFADFEGEVVFLNIWATWCPPCIAEMPDINDLYNEMNDQQVNFVLVSVDQDFQKARM